ncbi:MAG: methionyl-tRNA formyltransferase [Pseudonocardiaceae bacterium]
MRIVFMGYQTWGHRVLEALLESRHEIPLVITHPTSSHPYETIWNHSVAELAAACGIPYLVRKRVDDDEASDRIRHIAPDILVSSDWRTWVPPCVYRLAKHGAINIHDALLPKYGGFAPLNWALINGEPEVGVTVHFMNEEFDLGDIVLQSRISVRPKDTATDLFQKTIELFPSMTLEALDLIESGRTDWQPQDPAKATFFHKRSAEDSRIDWQWPAACIVNLVRAQPDPYPNAFAYYRGRRVGVLEASVSLKRYGGTVGRVFCPQGEGIVVVCGPRARTGHDYGVVLERVRDDDGQDFLGREFFTAMGEYLTSQP